MQVKNVIAASIAASVASATYTPGDNWSTLTPSATYSCGVTDFSSFGIAIKTISAAATSATTKAKRDVISQIGDGQIQAPTAPTSVAVVTETIANTVVYTTTVSSKVYTTTVINPVSQISDGQVEATTSTTTPASSTTTLSSSSASACPTTSLSLQDSSCKNSGTLSVTLDEGVLTDAKGRIGSIVSNRQFQFDGPPPQAGAIYANGWSITPEGNLAIGDNDIFYECLSGNFYNLYDENIAEQCIAIHLEAVELVSC
ncbi:related to Cell wall mannoprotein CIS3 [Saccharomycodes ludwigii]|uniref:Related to Cell wall mannoprotein CIS3 n=1 Tax=Saccharomycodes ludwigii TaxID=36035 RepID=A0A376B9C8_9ASCO|nr:hypothetical protein SCDLUD_002592 [Saccharomycodes ludwigii]KAH3901112.1 hypothetical protein SCDLUD_002592 [Saccharomycodes ludwigii]SSD61252.1 related to Cell wall mannoprotein CIS3 [Saccharomycodes ludwigii]